jgi:hypothetical protein
MVQGASGESRDAKYTFYVPKSMNLSIDGKGWENGDIIIEGMAGEVEAKSNIGDLHIIDVTGPLVLLVGGVTRILEKMDGYLTSMTSKQRLIMLLDYTPNLTLVI